MTGAASCRVLVLRPMPGNAETVERLEQLGITAVSAPLFAMEPVDWSVPSADGCDTLLLSSANAVRHAGPGLAQVAHLPCWCVGDATAAAASGAGLEVERIGSGGIASLVQGGNRKMLWLCGVQHSVLPESERHRVIITPVYRSVDLSVPADLFVQPCVAVLHSVRAARRFASLVDRRDDIAVAAISAEVAAAAGSGWRAVVTVAAPTDAQMVAVAAKLCQESDRGMHP